MIGRQADVFANTDAEGTAVGYQATVGANRAVAIGSASDATANDAIAIGHNASAGGVGTVVIGDNTSSTQPHSIILGNNTDGYVVGIGISNPRVALDINAKGCLSTQPCRIGRPRRPHSSRKV